MTRKFCRGAIDEFQAAIETVNTESGFFKESGSLARFEKSHMADRLWHIVKIKEQYDMSHRLQASRRETIERTLRRLRQSAYDFFQLLAGHGLTMNEGSSSALLFSCDKWKAKLFCARPVRNEMSNGPGSPS
jgi:hypothetical protein